MANANITQLQLANTFNQWRIVTNNLSNSVNELRNGNYWKDTGNFTVGNGIISITSTSGTVLTCAADALISGILTANSIIVTKDVTIIGNTYMSGANDTLQVANNITAKQIISNNSLLAVNANISGILNVSSVDANTLTMNVANGIYWSPGNTLFQLKTNGDIIANNITIQGNTVTTGQQILNTNRFVIANSSTGATDGFFQIYQGSSINAATIAWDSVSNNFTIANVTSNVYYSILTAANIADVSNSQSTIQVVSANIANSLNTTLNAAYTLANAAYAIANSGASGSAYNQANNAYNTANAALPKAGGTMTGNIVMSNGSAINTPIIASYREAMTSIATGSTYTANIANTNVFDLTIQAATTTITFINAAVAGNAHSITLILRQPSTTGNLVAFSNTVKWSNGELPVLSAGIANKLDVITLLTVDGGTSYFASHAMANV